MSQRGEKPRAKLWSTGLILSLLVLLVPLGIGGGGGGGIIPPDIFSYSFIIQAPALNTYTAYRTGVSAVTPFATESNFTKLVYDDIIRSNFCAMGCSIKLNAGNYNQTQKIPVDRQSVTIAGTPESIIYPQPTFTTPAFNVSGNSFIFSGPRIDDFGRRFASTTACSNLPGTPCHIAIAMFAGDCIIRNSQIFNITSVGIFLQIVSARCQIESNIIAGIPAQFTNASLGTMQGIEASGMNHKIEFNTISYIRGGAGIRIGAGTTNNAVHSAAIGNTIFHNEYGINSLRGVDIKMAANTIYNSTGWGIFLDTGIAAPNVWGPAVITGNSIGESGQGLCCGVAPGSVGHLELRGTRCCWYGVSITGNVMLDRQSNMTSKYDIEIATQNYRNLTITGNSLGNVRTYPSIQLLVNPPDKSWIITANPGFNAAPKRSLIAGASPYTYTNNDAYMEQLELTNVIGLTGLVCRGNNQVIAVNALTSVLNTVDTCVFTWAGTAPEFDVLPLQG